MVAQLPRKNDELTIAESEEIELNALIESITPEPESQTEEYIFDDLAFLSQQIDEMLRLKDRGDDYASTLAVVQQAVKGMAVEFGMVREILNRQDENLKAIGLKIHLVPLSV